MNSPEIPAHDQIASLIKRGAIFAVNHSGGKDSQAMLALLNNLIPRDQIIVIHATLPGMEWPGVIEHIEDNCFDQELIVTQANKTFFEMVKHRGYFPTPQYRQCTSDLKRTPIEKALRHWLKDHDKLLIVNCMGLRAQESSARARKEPFTFSERNSKAGREWYDWLPIFNYKIQDVFAEITAANQSPHWAYTSAGVTRLSCALCIMASDRDLKVGAKHNPALLAAITKLEKLTGHYFRAPQKGRAPKHLEDHIAALPDQATLDL